MESCKFNVVMFPQQMFGASNSAANLSSLLVSYQQSAPKMPPPHMPYQVLPYALLDTCD